VLEQIRRHLRYTPFQPFEIHTSGGEVFCVKHPENAAVLNLGVAVAMPDGENMAMVSALHIVAVIGLDPVPA
jgi:hypothetical protein